MGQDGCNINSDQKENLFLFPYIPTIAELQHITFLDLLNFSSP
jgi:hypothetical protein